MVVVWYEWVLYFNSNWFGASYLTYIHICSFAGCSVLCFCLSTWGSKRHMDCVAFIKLTEDMSMGHFVDLGGPSPQWDCTNPGQVDQGCIKGRLHKAWRANQGADFHHVASASTCVSVPTSSMARIYKVKPFLPRCFGVSVFIPPMTTS